LVPASSDLRGPGHQSCCQQGCTGEAERLADHVVRLAGGAESHAPTIGARGRVVSSAWVLSREQDEGSDKGGSG
jgi:hypothetical protein